MLLTRSLVLLAAVSLAACTLELDENASALQFSDQPLAGDSLALAGNGDDPALLSDLTNEAGTSGGDLLSLFATAPADIPAAATHRFGDQVAYGEMATLCDAPRTLGTKIASVGGFTIYDSNPSTTGLRAHYIKGFDDRCARQFSAALVMTGDVGTHEVIRYLPSNRAKFNKTDNAYEAIKAGFCRVRHGKPCGTRLDALARNTTFLTAYETFGSRALWVEVLLHDGEMSAIDFKTN